MYNSLDNRSFLAEFIKVARCLPSIAAGFALVFFKMVDVLNNGDRDNHVVHPEFKHRLRFIQKHGRIENVICTWF